MKFWQLITLLEDYDESQRSDTHISDGDDDRFFGKRGAGVLFFCKNTKRFLLGLRSEQVNEGGTWGIFGGKIEENEDPKEAAKREASEEAGVEDITNLELIKVFKQDNFRYYDYISFVDEEFEPNLNWENDEAEWFALENFPDNIHYGVKDILPDLKKYVNV